MQVHHGVATSRISNTKPLCTNTRHSLAKAQTREGFAQASVVLALEYLVTSEMRASTLPHMVNANAVAERMGTTKSAVSWLESACKHTPSLDTLRPYAAAVGCDLQVELVLLKAG